MEAGGSLRFPAGGVGQLRRPGASAACRRDVQRCSPACSGLGRSTTWCGAIARGRDTARLRSDRHRTGYDIRKTAAQAGNSQHDNLRQRRKARVSRALPVKATTRTATYYGPITLR